MNKSEAIKKCLELLKGGVYAMPSYNVAHNDWVITVNHAANVFGYELTGLIFEDCSFNR